MPGSCFSMGEGTLEIPFSMHADHRRKLAKAMKDKAAEGVVFVKGGDETPVYDSDTKWDFKQESNFQWLFGVKEPGCMGFVDIATGEGVLLIPRHPAHYATWMGPLKQCDWFRETYEVDKVFFTDEVDRALGAVARLHVLGGTNLDSGIQPAKVDFPGVEKYKLDDTVLWDVINELRVIKDPVELEIMQFVNDVSSQAHIQVMRAAQTAKKEYISEATFRYHSFLRGCARVGYNCICPAGERNTYLHYGHSGEPNAEDVGPGELKLHDMGAEYHCYTADVTVTFPIGGKFTAAQRVVYEAVWDATVAVEKAIKPGVEYSAMHILSQRVMLERLRAAGLFTGEVDAMLADNVMAHFMPHGLGHMLGLNVHDVAGYEPGKGKEDLKKVKPYPITQNLRLSRTLAEGMVLTVEPGCYFGKYQMQLAKETPAVSRHIDFTKLEELAPVGGVRIEDDVVVTSDGCKVFTRVPRTVEDIEKVIAGSEWDEPCRVYHGEGTA